MSLAFCGKTREEGRNIILAVAAPAQKKEGCLRSPLYLNCLGFLAVVEFAVAQISSSVPLLAVEVAVLTAAHVSRAVAIRVDGPVLSPAPILHAVRADTRELSAHHLPLLRPVER